jgi:AraC-like DNA-binding protein
MDFSFSLIKLLLFTACLLSVVTFYLNYKIKSSEIFGKVLLFILFYILLNSANSLIVEIFCQDEKWRGQLAPFILLYGPLLYFSILAIRDHQFSIWRVLPHATPFLGYSIFFVALSIGAIKYTATLGESINTQLYIIGPVSFIVYAFVSLLNGRKLFASKYRDHLLLFVFARVALLFLGMLFLIMFFSKSIYSHPDGMLLLRMIAYTCMIIFVLLIFNFSVNKLLNRFSKNGSIDQNLEKDQVDVKYEKSPLSNNQLKIYREKLNNLMVNEKAFLDTGLSLTSLAHLLKIPNHHLTQVFSMQLNQTFYQYINSFRIDYACALLTKNLEMNLEELAEKSGFNSKPSFNRQFKALKKCTPSEYRNQNKSD